MRGIEKLEAAGLNVVRHAPLAKRTTWRVGGTADALVAVRTAEELATTLQIAASAGLPVVPLGAGSNVLVADAGVRGVVVQLVGELADTAMEDGHLVAAAGLKLVVLLARAAREGWPGLHALAGIPGTVGGAVRMNAGTSLGEIGDALDAVEVVHADGSVAWLPREALALGYRTTSLPPGSVVTRARLRLAGEAEASAEHAATFLARRKATQPLDLPSCGSTFRNPPGDAAGRLIEAAGLKGYTVGGAQVSTKHANFVVNLGEATAADVLAVVTHARSEVLQQLGVALEPEFQALGAWEDAALLTAAGLPPA